MLSVDNNAAQNFKFLAISESSYKNILMVQTKLFSDLYLAKFLDISAKPFFSYTRIYGLF